MTRCVPQRTVSLALTILVTAGVGTARAQDDDVELGWSDTAELTAVFTGGNAEASTVGFKNELMRAWESSDLALGVAEGRSRAGRCRPWRTGRVTGRLAAGAAGGFSEQDPGADPETASGR